MRTEKEMLLFMCSSIMFLRFVFLYFPRVSFPKMGSLFALLFYDNQFSGKPGEQFLTYSGRIPLFGIIEQFSG